MNMSTWAIRTPVPSLALFLVLTIIGWVSFKGLPVTEMPNVDIPIISVSVSQSGAAPAEIATQIVQPLESAISDVTGVDHVTATASDGLASLTVEFSLETDTDRALNDVKDAVTSAKSDLPEAASDPVVARVDVTGRAILTYAVSDPTKSIEELSTFVDDVVARDIAGAEGVGKVTRLGGAERAIEVDLDPARLLALGLTASDVNSQLRLANVDMGGGSGDLAGQTFSIRALGAVKTVKALRATPITLASGRSLRLDDLGTVRDGAQEPEGFALLEGQPVVAFGVYRATGKSDLVAGDNAKAQIAALQTAYPGVSFSLIDDATVYTAGNYESAMGTLYEGAVLAIIVVFGFLRNWRATLITAAALPLSIIPTFIVMNYLGFSLNTVSLLGITLVTGILVDDAIVEIENIVRHIHMGKPAYEASEEAASEIGMTVIAISFTIVAVFLPVSFMSGIAGQFFKQFGLTVAVAVLFSLLVARLITPMLSAYFLRDSVSQHEAPDGALMRTYLRVLTWTLHNRTVTLLGGLAIFAGSIFSATLLPTEFVPASDKGAVNISVELPPGSSLNDTRLAARKVTEIIRQVPEVTSVFAEATTRTKANILVNLGQKASRSRSAATIQAELDGLLADFPDVRLRVMNDSGARDISLSILGDRLEATTEAARALSEAMNALPEVTGASASSALARPEIRITPKPELAAELGVTASALASTIRIATLGDSGTNVAQFNTGTGQIPIVVRLSQDVRDDLSLIGDLRVPRSTGAPIPLGVVADATLSTGSSTITRYDRQFRTTVEADLAPGALLGEATAAIDALPLAQSMPEGTRLQSAGDAEVMGEIFGQFGLAMGAGVLLVYVVLVLLFSSFVTPLTILLSLPLAIGGAIFALYLYGAGIGLSVVIGFLMLMGIVTKNAIMLVEFALDAMAKGVDKNAAMLDACHKRARPIIMTTIAMVAGMVPSALALGTGGEFRAPMAVAVIGGLILSTLLSLLFVPSLFSVIDRVKDHSRSILVHRLGANRPRAG
ncbi:efflux RND transporter permease subunit [Rhodobacter sp. KR11]|uniref:efflux RND transporter permease subunit n=1 Tax=Rhodobacter sp. KR11 TaxID=2974588 RepID=UPI0022233CC7|nr:efflux RND transporter permease subunit [Rhodobacter sp. KR11]MCW1920533.1 efflux RND transporter permease subunit [Rhodobacter sp. KR11]